MKNKSALKISILYSIIYVCFYVFSETNYTVLSQRDTLFCMGTSGFISIVGILILYLKKTNDPQADTFRLLIMITVQLLSYLSICLALIYTNQRDSIVLHLLGLALVLILAQTMFIVNQLKTANKFEH